LIAKTRRKQKKEDQARSSRESLGTYLQKGNAGAGRLEELERKQGSCRVKSRTKQNAGKVKKNGFRWEKKKKKTRRKKEEE